MYKSQIVADRLKILVELRGTSLNKLFEDCEMGRNSMSHLTNGSMPKGSTLAKMADYLECSVDYLLGRTDVVEVNRK